MLSFQPSELAKFALVVYLSYFIAKKGERIRDFMNGLVPAYVVTGVLLAVAIIQPDFGAAMTLALRRRHPAVRRRSERPPSWRHRRWPRFPSSISRWPTRPTGCGGSSSFLDPWADPQGAGHQIIQSFLAFGSGGVFGRGLGEGRQKLLFLPERHSDFIYAVIGEELGLIGALGVLALFPAHPVARRAHRARGGRCVQQAARARHHAPDLLCRR